MERSENGELSVWQACRVAKDLRCPSLLSPKTCNGRALDRVTKQKHRPNRQKVSKNCPKIVFSAPPDNFWTFFGHFFGIFRTFCRHSLFRGCPTICPLQPKTFEFCNEKCSTQWARRDRLMSRGKNCRETIFVSHLSRNYPHRGVNFD